MARHKLSDLGEQLQATKVIQRIGRVAEVSSVGIVVRGLSDVAAIGDGVSIGSVRGEVIRLDNDNLTALPEGPCEGIRVGERVFAPRSFSHRTR